MRRHCGIIFFVLIAVGQLSAQWQRTTNPQVFFDVKCVRVQGSQVGVGVIDYTTQSGGGIWLSSDTGSSWVRTLSGKSVESYLQDGANFCATTTFSGILFSSDAGSSWQQAAVVGGGQTYSMLLKSGSVLYGGVLGAYPVANGVLRSTDNGVTWSPSGTGINGEGVVALASFDSIMLAGAFHTASPAGSGGVYRSVDGGATWVRTSSTGTTTSAFASNGTTFFAGTDRSVYRSSDYGLTWTLANSGMPTQGITGLVVDGTTVYAGTKGKGVFKSTDNGDHWSALNNGLTDQNIRTLASNGFILFAGTSGGLWRLTVKVPVSPPRDLTADAGSNEVSLSWHGTGDFKSLKYIVYQGTVPAPTSPVDTVVSTTGNSFTKTIGGLIAGLTYYFRVAAMDSTGNRSEFSNEVSATPFGFGSLLGVVADSSRGLKGVTVKLLDTLMSPLAELVTDTSGTVFFPHLRGGVYDVMVVEPLGYTAGTNPVRVSVTPPDTGKAVFLLTQVITTSKARSAWYWKQQFDVAVYGKGTAQESTEALLKYIENITVCYTQYFPMFRSSTGLTDWQTILSPKLFGPFRTWAESELGALLLNLASLKVGQYTVATKDGRTVGEVALHVSDMIMDSDSTNELLAAFFAWECNMNLLIGPGIIPKADIMLGVGDDQKSPIPVVSSLMDNYPNPFNPSTGIRYQVSGRSGQSAAVSLKVYDVLGREVATLVNSVQAPGTYNVTWNAAGLSSGVYLYRLEAGAFVQTKKMMLLK